MTKELYHYDEGYARAETHDIAEWIGDHPESLDRLYGHILGLLVGRRAAQPDPDPDYPPNPAIVEAFAQACKEHRSFMNPVGFDDSNTAREWRDRKK